MVGHVGRTNVELKIRAKVFKVVIIGKFCEGQRERKRQTDRQTDRQREGERERKKRECVSRKKRR